MFVSIRFVVGGSLGCGLLWPCGFSFGYCGFVVAFSFAVGGYNCLVFGLHDCAWFRLLLVVILIFLCWLCFNSIGVMILCVAVLFWFWLLFIVCFWVVLCGLGFG